MYIIQYNPFVLHVRNSTSTWSTTVHQKCTKASVYHLTSIVDRITDYNWFYIVFCCLACLRPRQTQNQHSSSVGFEQGSGRFWRTSALCIIVPYKRIRKTSKQGKNMPQCPKVFCQIFAQQVILVTCLSTVLWWKCFRLLDQGLRDNELDLIVVIPLLDPPIQQTPVLLVGGVEGDMKSPWRVSSSPCALLSCSVEKRRMEKMVSKSGPVEVVAKNSPSFILLIFREVVRQWDR